MKSFTVKDLDRELRKVFGFSDVNNIASGVIERIDFDDEDLDIDEALLDAINDYIIYYDDQWEIMKFYQNPTEANFSEAIEEFYSDCYNVVMNLIQ